MEAWLVTLILLIRTTWVFAVWAAFFYGVFVLNHSAWWVILALILTAGGITNKVTIRK